MADSRATEANRILALIRADQRSTALLIGHQGRMARSIRAILEAVGNQDSWHYHLTIEESPLDQYLRT